ncbi:MAG: sulfite exporter TauE/SafE family protein [Oscillospiraceae bacterium]|nr:sulfite exporter TauE/SafE family protein [Oscillospiraceae bacterium]
MTELLTLFAAFITGLLASMGVGGGMVLIIWMTAFMGVPQLEAQGINLIFFLPIALLSCILHRKNGLMKIEPLLPAIMTGVIGAAAGALLADFAGSEILGKCFSGFILLIGLKEIFTAKN